MAIKYWLGGGNNRASNTRDWSTGAAPVAGDVLYATPMFPGQAASYTMNIQGHDLAGDFLSVGLGAHYFGGALTNLTANLSAGAAVSATLTNTNAVFNMTGSSSLGMIALTDPHAGADATVINTSGFNVLNLVDTASNIAVNIANASVTAGIFNLASSAYGDGFSGTLTVIGAANASYWSYGPSTVGHGQHARIMADVIGAGTFTITPASLGIAGSLEFGGAVGPSQSITDSGRLLIDQPGKFQGHITLAGAGEVDLAQFGSPTSYSLHNDILSIYIGERVVDSLHFTDHTPYGFVIHNNANGGTGIFAITDPAHPGAGVPVHG